MGVSDKYLVIIGGPTAVGKTDLTIRLAKEYNTVVLSADSRQFYREMTIGTAKPTPLQQAEVKHYFIDTKSVGQLYGAGHYEKDAIGLLNQLFTDHNIVFMTGGSGLYINAVVNGVDDFEEVPPGVRSELNSQFLNNGLDWLRQELKKHDPVYFETVDIHNSQRMIRALEVCLHTGKPYSTFLEKEKPVRDFTVVSILLNTKREELYARINRRVDEMMQNGLMEEVKSLTPYRDFNALKTVGYNELFEYLDGKISLAAAVEKIKQHTRNYAKRQLTWVRNKGDFEEFEPGDYDRIKSYIDIIVTHGQGF